jgi:hypothetical protein
MMVAVGFNPRFAVPPNIRRVATAERSHHASPSSVAPRRGELECLDRGMNPTATIATSLRDERLVAHTHVLDAALSIDQGRALPLNVSSFKPVCSFNEILTAFPVAANLRVKS